MTTGEASSGPEAEGAAPDICVYVDTNAFIHLRDLEDLPWRELFPKASTIEIAVAHLVLEELDRLKEDPANRRRRDRARLALGRIDEASDAPDLRVELRQADPRVLLRLSCAPPPDWSRWPRLDRLRPDDQLVAAALSDDGEAPVVLLSADSGPRVRARMAGLKATKAPDSWRLPDADPDQREIGRLQRRLAELEAVRPSLSLSFPDAVEGRLAQGIDRLPPLPDGTRAALSAELERRFPRRPVEVTTRTPFRIALFPGEIGAEDVAEYDSEYRSFLDEKRALFEQLHLHVSYMLRVAEVRFRLQNLSAVTAERVIVTFDGPEGIQVLGDPGDVAERLGRLPHFEPPEPPTGQFPTLADHLYREGILHRDPTAFFDQPVSDERERRHAQTCAEFRARQVHEGRVWLVPKEGLYEGRLHVTVTASNLAEPLEAEVEVAVAPAARSWTEPDVLGRLPDWMADIIKAGT